MELPTHTFSREYDRLYKEMDDLYRDAASSLGLSDSAMAVLYTLCELGDGCLQKDICAHCFLPKQTVHSSVRKLEKEGVLSLRPGRGRDMHLYLTEEGVRLAEKTVLPLAQAEIRALSAMSPQEQEHLIRLTKQYVSLLRGEFQQLK